MASRLRYALNYVIRIHSIKMCNTADIMIITIYWQYFYMIALHPSYLLKTNDLHNAHNAIQETFTIYIKHLKNVKNYIT